MDFLAYADVGTVLHPRALGGQILGRSITGIGHTIGQKWVYDQNYGLPVSKRFHHTKPPTILDIPQQMAGLLSKFPTGNAHRRARNRRAACGGGCAAILNALSDALGDEVFRRAPVTADVILASLEAGKPTQDPLRSNI